MYNSDIPARAELPSSRQLVKSTITAIVAAAAILVTIVLPSEYAIDPTGVGGVLGLTEMGEIKSQLSKEAEADRLMEEQKAKDADQKSSAGGSIFGFFIGQAQAQTAATAAEWKDRYEVVLKPGEGIEVKLVMEEGAEAQFSWKVEGGKVNYDLHGDGSGQNISYEKGRGVPGHEGILKAAFTGNHGWFWRNRDKQDVKVILNVKGDYSEMKLPN